MNVYERIQKVVDEIESRIESGSDLDGVCDVSGFSTTHCYRLFHSLCGRPVIEYARSRLIAKSVSMLQNTNIPIIKIAQECGYGSQEAFTRIFRAELGTTPAKVRFGQVLVNPIERIDLFDKYFDKVANTFYPDPKVKVIKNLPDMNVASFIRESVHPERDALKAMYNWALNNNILSEPFRIFGFDNPEPQKGKPEYGYEVWITVPDGFKHDGDVEIKRIPSQTYAVIHTVLSEIDISWRHFFNWLKLSKYDYGNGQCLEEHLTEPELWDKKELEFDLYMPIRESKNIPELRKEYDMSEVFEIDMEGFPVATYCHKSSSPENDGWKVIGKWAKENNLLGSDAVVFGFDNPSPNGKDPVYGYEFWVKIPDDMVLLPPPLIRKQFKGGHFACLKSDVPHVGVDWKRLVRWVEDNNRKWASCQCLERSLLDESKGDDIKLLLMLPIEA